ncbi:MAG: CaiB/BaiF CoA-transferase family protein [Deltaproteobacteria bacterium]|nr:CaiB/BaiF CoA-transferase family protein [Deltaproteobacteria bacterium]
MKLKVLDLSRLLPGPFASQILADLGAEVLKVEDPLGGDYLRWMPPLKGSTSVLFAALNRGKRSLALSLKSEAGREVFLDLLRQGWDIVLESFRPGVMDRLGLSEALLRAAAPGLILCSISGFGAEGEDAPRAGHDLGYISRAGVAHLLGRAGEAPVVPGVQIADLAGGAYPAACGILAAALQREQTGEGAHLQISMTHAAASLLTAGFAGATGGGEPLARGELVLGGGAPCYGFYACADGKQLAVAALEPQFWERFCAALELPELSGRGLDRGEAGAEVRATLEARFATKPQAEWEAFFREHDCCVEPVREGLEALDDPYLGLRERMVSARLPGEEEALEVLPTPLADPATAPTEVPGLGEHTGEVLRSLGYDADRIEALATEGVIGGA